MLKEIIVASNNKGKIKEVKDILNGYKILSQCEAGIEIDIEEDGKTFKENAEKKAAEIAKLVQSKIVIADDSGIEIESLDGFPGVYTKRWHVGSDRDRNLAIIEKLNGFERERRKVKFTTSIAFSDGVVTKSVEAYIEGYITESPRGNNGFGFDEIFELEDGRTLAELSNEEKNKISARRKALEEIKKIIK